MKARYNLQLNVEILRSRAKQLKLRKKNILSWSVRPNPEDGINRKPDDRIIDYRVNFDMVIKKVEKLIIH